MPNLGTVAHGFERERFLLRCTTKRVDHLQQTSLQTRTMPSDPVSLAGALEIIILGVTQPGAPFRPSDWADRLCGVMSIFGEDQRISYSPYVNPSVADGHKCVRVDTRLKALNPDAFAFLMGFARDNELRLHAPSEAPGLAAQGLRG
jgi:hypothetical protein